MNMITKDKGLDTSKPMQPRELISFLGNQTLQVNSEVMENVPSELFRELVSNWMVTKLTDVNGIQLDVSPQDTGSYLNFVFLMAEICLRSFGGMVGMAQQRFHDFYDSLVAQGYNLDDREIFLRFIYSCLDYINIVRPHDLIVKRK
jgi:hypothetical protein